MNGNRNARLWLAMPTLVAIVVLPLAAGVSMTHAAWAQAQPTATPRPLVHVPIPMPVNPPKGWDPKQWASLREKCQEYYDKSLSHIPLTMSEFRTLDTCSTLVPYPSSVTREPSRPQSQPPVPLPTPMPTPIGGGAAH
jgi:hypothetical protein